ncbi:hypothetical protein B0H13DRAFT_1873450 [Mycena leptocephala]|nr:hypothetical protein B0H13DRAFT_1873450 [Mycena leptocephala]
MKSVPRCAMGSVVGLVLLSAVAVGRRACVAVLAQEGGLDSTLPQHSLILLLQNGSRLAQKATSPQRRSAQESELDPTFGAFRRHCRRLCSTWAQHYFITSNADYVPAVPSITVPHAVFLRSDMRYGTDDPTLWPQQWTAEYPHMPLISTKGSCPELDVMWWDPLPTDFAVGSAVMRGLGRLTHAWFSRLLPPINELVARCKELHRTSPALTIPLFGALIQHITMWAGTAADSANNLWAAKVPFWFLRPVDFFDAENILRVVPLREPEFDLPDANAHGAGAPPVLYSGNSTLQKIEAIKRAAVHTPWYCDPFETTDTCARSPLPDPPTPLASSSRSAVHPRSSVPVALSSPPVARNCPQQSRSKPYSAKPPAPKGPVKTERDKFSPLLIQQMPPSIVSMANALALVDRSVTPYTSKDADKRYVLPEPVLLVNTAPSDVHPQLLRPQEWRDILEGLLTKCGPVGSPRYRRSERLLDCIRPALQACHLSSVEGFPVPVESLPEFSLEQTREIVWQTRVTEESAGRGQGLFCWPYAGGGAIGDEPTSTLMLDWTTQSPRPNIIRRVADRFLNWSPTDMEALETAVCCYYTQAFWEHFGRAAVVPLRLDHALEKEDDTSCRETRNYCLDTLSRK